MTEVIQENGFTIRNVFPKSQKEKDRQEFVRKVGMAMKTFQQEKEEEAPFTEH